MKIYYRVLTSGQIKEDYVKDTVKLNTVENKPTKVTIPKTSFPINIDGTIENKEWAQATDMFGFMRLDYMALTDRLSKVFMTYDDKNLYFGFRVDHNGSLVSDSDKRDSAVYGDDAVEIFLYPEKDRLENVYQIIVNSKGAIFDSLGGNTAWNGNVKAKARVSKNTWEIMTWFSTNFTITKIAF